jgi:YgiT-type zinc finger domain-containing protein
MQKYHVCHVCGGEMHPKIESSTYRFNDVDVTVNDIRIFRCVSCNEGVLESDEAKRIEKIILQKANANINNKQ